MVLLSALFAGCASLSLERDAGTARDGFELFGRVAVRYGSDGASGRIAWRHSRAADELLVTSALGQGMARITRRSGDTLALQPGDALFAQIKGVALM